MNIPWKREPWWDKLESSCWYYLFWFWNFERHKWCHRISGAIWGPVEVCCLLSSIAWTFHDGVVLRVLRFISALHYVSLRLLEVSQIQNPFSLHARDACLHHWFAFGMQNGVRAFSIHAFEMHVQLCMLSKRMCMHSKRMCMHLKCVVCISSLDTVLEINI